MIKLKRIYEKYKKSDGYRILVDRLWPRGVSKEKAALDLWLKEIAPSNALRKWFSHDLQKWPEFKKRYIEELRDNHRVVSQLDAFVRKRTVTLLYAAKDKDHNEAVVIRDFVSG
jgi:uncharacterized protein YeaO (DUF488 family)